MLAGPLALSPWRGGLVGGGLVGAVGLGGALGGPGGGALFSRGASSSGATAGLPAAAFYSQGSLLPCEDGVGPGSLQSLQSLPPGLAGLGSSLGSGLGSAGPLSVLHSQQLSHKVSVRVQAG